MHSLKVDNAIETPRPGTIAAGAKTNEENGCMELLCACRVSREWEGELSLGL